MINAIVKCPGNVTTLQFTALPRVGETVQYNGSHREVLSIAWTGIHSEDGPVYAPIIQLR